jgi:hypothetical protein
MRPRLSAQENDLHRRRAAALGIRYADQVDARHQHPLLREVEVESVLAGPAACLTAPLLRRTLFWPVASLMPGRPVQAGVLGEPAHSLGERMLVLRLPEGERRWP